MLTVAALLLAALGAACGASSTAGREPASRGFEQKVIAGGLEAPWALAFLPDGSLLVTERPGRIRLVRNGRLLPEPVAEIDVARRGEAGLLGLALHPDFADEPLAFVYYTARSGRENRIVSFRVTSRGRAGLRFERERVLVAGIPAASVHDGGRLTFGPNGMLYATTGDAGQPALAADPASLAGKILRLEPDGSIPNANPFGGSPVWSYGHRNPQGLAWDEHGRLYGSEHGPTGDLGLCCHDEVNLIRRGAFYGWPLRAGRVVAGTPAELGLERAPADPLPPIAESGRATWAPSGISVHRPSSSVFVATLAAEKLLRLRLDPDDPAQVVGQEVALQGEGRLREVARGPDGCLYVLTSNRDGRGSPRPGDDRLIRLCERSSR